MSAAAIFSRAQSVSAEQPQGQPDLTIVPILGPSHDQPPYELLRQETLNHVQITEVSQQGSVPNLRVENKLNVRVFLMDGQELVGAKQNRILNTDVLVPANSSLTIPVSCVEQGRWSQVSASFSSGRSASHRTRAAKLERVRDSLRSSGVHDADQGAVWQEVAMSLRSSAVASPTMALNDAYAKRDQELTAFRQSLRMPSEAVGVAAFQGGRWQGIDIFDRHSTLAYFWTSLVDSYALDLLAAPPVDPSETQQTSEAQVIRSLLDRAASGKWQSFDSPGEGEDWRLEDEQLSGSTLLWKDEVVLHLQLFPKHRATEGQAENEYRPRISRRYRPNR